MASDDELPLTGYRRQTHRHTTILDGGHQSSDSESSGSSFTSNGSSLSGSLTPKRVTSSNKPLAESPLLRKEIVNDEDAATYVLVFTRAASPGVSGVDCDETIDKPLEKARKIFMQDRHIEGLDDEEEMDAETYHDIVRHKIEALLSTSGFVCSCFSSVDGDETFLKLYLDPNGATVRKLAEQFRYEVPVSKSNYRSSRRIITDGSCCFGDGLYCFAYTPFTLALENEERLQPFRRVDVIRIAHRHLSNLINLEELEKQNFIATHFPVAGYKEKKWLWKEWGLPLGGGGALPPQVRDYFGEKIGFFFHFFAFYVRGVCLLSVGALCFIWMDLPFGGWVQVEVPVDKFTKSNWRVGLGAGIVLWAIFFEIILNRSCARMAHVWGMKATTRSFVPRVMDTFDKRISRKWKETRLYLFSRICAIMYCGLFIMGVFWIRMPWDWGHLEDHKCIIITFLVGFAKWGWGKYAPWLTEMENHKTHDRFEDALTFKLWVFKFIFTLWPPLSIFLLDKLMMAYCAPTFQEAVEMAYGNLREGNFSGGPRIWEVEIAGEPVVLNETTFEDVLRPYELTRYEVAFRHLDYRVFLPNFEPEEHCLAYCLPQPSSCERTESGGLAVDCETNCHFDLKYQVFTQFVFHVGFQVLFLVYTLGQVWWDIGKEEKAAVRRVSEEECDVDASPRTVHYTTLQVQAKCQRSAPYKYYSFGGSFPEDLLELVIGFAWICVFGIVLPTMIVMAAPTLLLEYRLVQMRMLLVTGRPYPEMAAGIGSWQVVMVMVGTIAVFFNGYLAAFVLGPARSRDFTDKFILFLCFSCGSLLVRTLLRNGLSDIPHDIRAIEDYNNELLKKLNPLEISMQFDQDGLSGRIDLGLRPHLDSPAHGVRRAESCEEGRTC